MRFVRDSNYAEGLLQRLCTLATRLTPRIEIRGRSTLHCPDAEGRTRLRHPPDCPQSRPSNINGKNLRCVELGSDHVVGH